MNDLKFAFRQLLKNPGFTAFAALLLALHFDATTAMSAAILDRIEYSYNRSYVAGEEYEYELTTRIEGAKGTEKSVSVHEVLLKEGIPVERVRWRSLIQADQADLSDAAMKILPYELSLDPRGVLRLVKPVDNSVMLG